MINIIVISAILISMLLILIRALRGKTLFDRMLAANSFGTKTVILIVMLGFITNNTMYLDIALVYVMINFIATIGFLKFLTKDSLGKE